MNGLERGAIISECNVKCIKILHSFSGTLTAAIPVALLNPGLGFRKKRSLVEMNKKLRIIKIIKTIKTIRD